MEIENGLEKSESLGWLPSDSSKRAGRAIAYCIQSTTTKQGRNQKQAVGND